MKRNQKQLFISNQMVLTGLGLAAIYWIIDSFMRMFFFKDFNFFRLLIGTNLDENWARIVVLCLFIIFGSHAQYTINSRKQAEKDLKISEERYRTLVDNLSMGIFRITPGINGKFLMANPAFLKMSGYNSEEELKKINVMNIYARPDEEKIFSEKVLSRGSISWTEVEFKKKNGSLCWALITAKLMKKSDEKDFITYFDCIVEDITEHKALIKKMKKTEATQEQFQKLLSPNLANMVISGCLRVEKGGEKRIATVMFADIRGFTSMSEKTSATEVLQMLNEYFEVIVEIVFRYEGTVDKFIGDEIMVIWGAPVTHDDDPILAVRAALDIQSVLFEFNKIRPPEEQIQVGIGINTGNLVAGYIGSSRTMSYSVIGDTVNTASRLCSAAKAGQIIISKETHGYLQGCFDVVELKPINAKGKSKPLQVFEVISNN